MPPKRRSELQEYKPAVTTKPKRCVAYSRMSSKAQGESPADQQASFKRIVKRYGLNWDGETYSDHGVSGWKTRDGLECLIEAVSQQQKADGLIVRSLNRLSRLPPLDSCNLLAKLRAIGIKVIYTDDQGELVLPAPDDAWGLAKLVMDSGVCHNFSRTNSYQVSQSIVAKLEDTVEKALKQPGWSKKKEPRLVKATGHPTPLGFKDERVGAKGSLMLKRSVVTEDADLIREMFAKFLSGITSSAIATWLNGKGIKTIRGFRWLDSSVDYVLTNRAYIGVYERCKTSKGVFTHALRSGPSKIPDQAKQGRANGIPAGVHNDPEDMFVIEDAWEPIVSKADFNRVQKMIAKRKEANRKPRSESGVLSGGIARCGHCGRPLRRHRFKKDGRVTYACERVEQGVEHCALGGHVREDWLLPQLMAEVDKALGKEIERLNGCLVQPATFKKSPTANLDKQIASLAGELASTHEQLVAMMKRKPAPQTAIDMAVNSVEQMSTELEELKAKRVKLEKLPEAEEAELREMLDWLGKHAVAVREWTITTPDGKVTKEYQPNERGAPYVAFSSWRANDDPKSPGTKYVAERLVYNASQLRQLLNDLGLSVTVTWGGKPGDARAYHPREAHCTFTNKSAPKSSGKVARACP